MTLMKKEDINKKIASTFLTKKEKIHIKRAGRGEEPFTVFRNGLVIRVDDEFIIIDDDITGREIIYYFEMKGYIEAYIPRGAI